MSLTIHHTYRYFALVGKEGRSSFGARQMLTFIQVVEFLATFSSIIIIHEYELPSHRVIKIGLSHQGIRTKHDLILFWQINTFVEIVAHYEFHIILSKHHIVLEQ